MIKPQGSRILVKLIDYENDTLELTDNYKEQYQTAEVVDVGLGTLLESGEIVKPDVKVGETVIISQTSGTMVTDGTEKFQIVAQKDIIGATE